MNTTLTFNEYSAMMNGKKGVADICKIANDCHNGFARVRTITNVKLNAKSEKAGVKIIHDVDKSVMLGTNYNNRKVVKEARANRDFQESKVKFENIIDDKVVFRKNNDGTNHYYLNINIAENCKTNHSNYYKVENNELIPLSKDELQEFLTPSAFAKITQTKEERAKALHEDFKLEGLFQRVELKNVFHISVGNIDTDL